MCRKKANLTYFNLRNQNAINMELNINEEILCQKEMVVMMDVCVMEENLK